LGDFRTFNTDNLEWRSFKPSGEGIDGRRGHSASLVGRHMVIFGGANTRGAYTNDVYYLDIQ